MNIEQEYMEFYIAKAFAGDRLREKIVTIRDEKTLMHDLESAGLKDSQVLYRMMLKEVKEHNSNLLKKRTLLDNLNYQKNNWRQSKLFSGLTIPWKAITKIVKDNPESNAPYDLYRQLSNWH